MADKQKYGVSQCVNAILASENKSLINYILKDMTRKLVDVAIGQAFDSEKIISIKDDPVEVLKYTNQLIYKKHMYIEDLIRCRDCKHYDGRPCGIVDWYNTADDFCSKAERKDNG